MSEETLEAFVERWGLPVQAREELLEFMRSATSLGTFAPTGTNITVTIMDEGDETSEIDDPTERERYEILDEIGRGGFGTVHRVHDHHLNRTMAMKVLREKLQGNPDQRRRFLVEAQVTAQLQHPGVLPVHDLGRLDDGRLYYTMKEVQGRNFSTIIQELHGGGGEWTLRRAIGVLHRAAEAVGYAHARNVLHRDIKPTNIMVGDHGEVHVVDWGLAAVRGAPEPHGRSQSGESDSVAGTHESRAGSVVGTVAYMAPEQARGRTTTLGPHTDVWALGSVLFEVLTGARAHDTDNVSELLLLLEQESPDVRTASSHPVSEQLAAIAHKALQRRPEDRFVDASTFARALQRWLDGELRREKARGLVTEAAEIRPEVETLRSRARALEAEATAMSATMAPAAPVADKLPMWAREDEAQTLRGDAARRELDMIRLLQAALTHDAELDEAHGALASHYHRLHLAAESIGDTAAAARHAQMLSWHDRGWYTAYLEGTGRLTLPVATPGATAVLYRYDPIERRLQPVEVGPLALPIDEVQLPHGSYMVELSAPDHATVQVPVVIRRLSHWDALAPDGALVPVHLPKQLGPDEVLVPAGPWTTGDPVAFSALPAGTAWQEGFIIQRHPVDNASYKRFLDALVDLGREEDAQRYAPQQVGVEGGAGTPLWSRDHAGHFVLDESHEPDAPVVWVDWFCAKAYAAWFAEHTGESWRLPSELEWEKAARGVDGRAFPMGELLDPTWARVKASAPAAPSLVRNEAYPADRSPYGVRGMAGNVMNWCEEVFVAEGPALHGRLGAPEPADPSPTADHVLRGGFWWCESRDARSALRLPRPAVFRFDCVGFRLVRSI